MAFPTSVTRKQGSQLFFSLPHPSNNASKSRVTLLEPTAGEIYELRRHQFSKGCTFNTQADLANERYHYTADQEPIKSTFLINETDRKDGRVMESGDFHFTTKFDLAFSLIGYHYRDSISRDEKEYESSSDVKPTESSGRMNCLTARDYHDHLVDSHDKQWANVSLESLEKAFIKVAEPTEEAGTTFYKLTDTKIIHYLAGKVTKLAQNLPKSLHLPSDLPKDILECAKVTMATDLLVSLVPKQAYQGMKSFTPGAEDLGQLSDIKNSYRKYGEYKASIKRSVEEKELLVKAAMSVGLATGNKRMTVIKKVTKKTVKVKKQKGRIDGFFKPAA